MDTTVAHVCHTINISHCKVVYSSILSILKHKNNMILTHSFNVFKTILYQAVIIILTGYIVTIIIRCTFTRWYMSFGFLFVSNVFFLYRGFLLYCGRTFVYIDK